MSEEINKRMYELIWMNEWRDFLQRKKEKERERRKEKMKEEEKKRREKRMYELMNR